MVLFSDFIVSESGVRRAVADLVREEQLIVEGSGAVGIAALEENGARFRDRRVVLVLTGANIDAGRLAEIIQEHEQ
jgi:threonine dehydratase